MDLSKLGLDSILLRVNLVSLLGNYSREARIHENCWTLEFSIHMREVMGSSDRYPVAPYASTRSLKLGSPDRRKLVLAGYRSYFDLGTP